MTTMQTKSDTNELSEFGKKLNQLVGKTVYVSCMGCINCMNEFNKFEWFEEPETWMDIEINTLKFVGNVEEQRMRFETGNIRCVKDYSVLDEIHLWIQFDNGMNVQIYSD